MHTSLPTWLALSAALSHTTTAFYPYHPADDNTRTSSQVRRVAPPPAPAAHPVTTLPIRRISTTLHTRQNAYNILDSKEPTQENSVAIDQDGGDLSYMVAVRFGDSKEEYHLLLDSAASNTWVMGQDCKSEACGTHNTFGKGDSGSLKVYLYSMLHLKSTCTRSQIADTSTQMDTKPFSISYGTGTVSGTLASDTIHMGALSPTLSFGLATTVSQEFRSYPMDGILGLGRGTTTSTSSQLIPALRTANLISTPIFGIHLSRASSGTTDGELSLGAANPSRYSGALTYVACVDTASTTGFWEIPVDDAGVNGASAQLPGRTAIIDTGTSYILMPVADALALHSLIPGFQQSGETFSVPCDTTAVLHFTLNQRAFNVSTADWRGGKLESGLCRSNVVGRQTFGAKQWLVGDVFLKNVYSVFDAGAGRVGFGVLGGAAEVEVQSATTGVAATKTAGGDAAASQTSAGGSVKASSTAAAAGSQSQTQGGSQSGAAGHIKTSLLGVFAALLMGVI